MTAPAKISRAKPVTLSRPARQAALEVARAESQALRVTERPRVALAGELVRVGDRVLDQAEAVRLWAELGDVLGLAERERRPRAWSFLVGWLDRAFLEAPELEVREGRERHLARVIRVAERRAMARIGPFAVAHLRLPRKSSKTYTGSVAYYFPGSMGRSETTPDALVSFTGRRIRVKRQALEAVAPLVTP